MRIITKYNSFFKYLTILGLALFVILLLIDQTEFTGAVLITSLASLAFYFMGKPNLSNFSFTIWVFTFVSVSMYYPQSFGGEWFGFDLKYLIVPLIQIIMFGMGTTLNIGDFTRVFKLPWPVFIGIILQFTIMPLGAFIITYFFNFEPEVAAGVILIGACPGGVASNLMVFLAGGDVALSVTMTSTSTLLSPVMTPLVMQTLAGQYISIDFLNMTFSILNMIIVPIIAGLVANKILYGKEEWNKKSSTMVTIGVVSLCLAFVIGAINMDELGLLKLIKNGFVIGFALMGIVALANWLISLKMKNTSNWMDKVLPIISMVGIVFIISIITARSSEKLLSVGLLLIAAAIIQNLIGYVLGYWLSRAAKLDEKSCRTVAFEVGMQNGGMATGLAMSVLKSSSAALAPAIFGPWMNVSGSILATWWKKKPVANSKKSVQKLEE